MGNFTQGGWYIAGNTILDNDHYPIADIFSGREEWEANARLVMYAPEMYELLREILDDGGCFHCNFQCRKKAKVLLAWIDGEEE